MSKYLLDIQFNKEVEFDQAYRVYAVLFTQNIVQCSEIPDCFLAHLVTETDSAMLLYKGFSPRDLVRLLEDFIDKRKNQLHRLPQKLNKNVIKLLLTSTCPSLAISGEAKLKQYEQFKQVCLEYHRVINWAGSRWHAAFDSDTYGKVLLFQFSELSTSKQVDMLYDLKARNIVHDQPTNGTLLPSAFEEMCKLIDRNSLIEYFSQQQVHGKRQRTFQHPLFEEAWSVAKIVSI